MYKIANTTVPRGIRNETLAASREHLKFENDDFICRGHILNAMSDPLFDIYQNYSTAKELWNALKERYFIEDATNLDKHLLIEEQYRLENKINDDASKVHVVEEKGESSKAGGKKCRHDDKDKKKSKKNKKRCHLLQLQKSRDISSRMPALKKNQDRGNDNKNKDNNFVAMISEAFSLEEEKSWWVDSRATQHVCNDQTIFKTHEPSYSMLYMGNHSTAQVKGKGFASTHLVKCSMAIDKNFKPPGAARKGPIMLIPQWLNGQALFTKSYPGLVLLLLSSKSGNVYIPILPPLSPYASMANSSLTSVFELLKTFFIFSSQLDHAAAWTSKRPLTWDCDVENEWLKRRLFGKEDSSTDSEAKLNCVVLVYGCP
ncbi:hypothetical protein Tco_0991797 [Tanacetum coccineum]|uniref:Retrovirus-related Pol polyprotein from transposon TNT 1-94-like beta-barrel domain-containing protein n=1 Tax=Tanacetum coccineum TaxID=301880 RepID=A0ABQ5F0E7_9ASTR